MADTNITFANIVPNTTPASWSQAYNAGKLYAVLSLQKNEPVEGQENLGAIGKEVISTFEQEFFTLENKDLDSIKHAIVEALSKIKEISSYSFVITYITGTVLYIFIAGSGSVILKRKSKIGTILESDDTSGEVKSASGFLQNGDLVILQTKNFSKIISLQSLADSLDHQNPSNISENLAPKIHEKQDGSAAAIILLYKDEKAYEELSTIGSVDSPTEAEESKDTLPVTTAPISADNFQEISLDNLEAPSSENENEAPKQVEEIETPQQTSQAVKEESLESQAENVPSLSELVLNQEEEPEEQSFVTVDRKPRRKFSLPIPRLSLRRLNHRRRLLLSIAFVILIVLGVSIFLGIKNKNDQAVNQAFAQIYPKASEKYKEGQNLMDLNQTLARDNFIEAQKILSQNKDKFKSGTSQDQQIEDLLVKVNESLDKLSAVSQSQATAASATDSDLISVELNNSGVNYFTQDATNVYFIDGSGVQQINKSTSKKTLIIKKSWVKEGGIGVFLGNTYILDKSASQIYKFAATTFAKSNYLTAKPDLSDTSSLAIDGSIYALSTDGSIQKFLRGASESFKLSGLDKPLNNPTKIFTDADTNNLYILDNGNSRIVVLNKTGAFQKQYPATVIKDAKDFDVKEKNKKIYVLSGGKVYGISL